MGRPRASEGRKSLSGLPPKPPANRLGRVLKITLLSGTRSLGLDLEVSVAPTGTGYRSRISPFSSSEGRDRAMGRCSYRLTWHFLEGFDGG